MEQLITKEGVAVPFIDWRERQEIIGGLEKEGLVTVDQIVEQGALCLSMVVRAALGLQALDGQVAAVADNTLCGLTVKASLRQLLQAGASASLWERNSFQEDSFYPVYSAFGKKLTSQLRKRGVNVFTVDEGNSALFTEEKLKQYHLLLLGVDCTAKWFEGAAIALNEAAIPVHTVDYPWGVNPVGKELSKFAIYASSTLFLGAPDSVYLNCPDNFGRVYLADISIPLEKYREFFRGFLTPFSAQPVVQLFLRKH